MGLVIHGTPIYMELKANAGIVKVHQYLMTLDARKGITSNIRRLLWEGILCTVQSAWNIPLLPVKKSQTNDYQPVLDLREVNKRVMDIHSTVSNTYTLLSMLPPEKGWYTLFDLKSAFFSLSLAPSIQRYFAFE